MANIDLRTLIPEGENTITLWDGRTFYLPEIGVKEMSRVVLIEEAIQDKESETSLQDRLIEANDELVQMLREANPNGGPSGDKIPDEGYDWTIEKIFHVITAMTGGTSAITAVREALTADLELENEEPSTAEEEAADLGRAAKVRDDDDAPLGSRKRSPKRSSPSATSAGGKRNGGTKPAGKSSSRTSRTPAANRSG